MSKLNRLCVTAIATLAVSTLAFAQGTRTSTSASGPSNRGRGGMQQVTVQDAVKQLELTADQQKLADPILKTDAEARQKLSQDLMQAFRDQDDKARTEAQDKIKALDASTKKQLAAVLTKEQTAKLERITGPGGELDRFVAMVNKLELTADQKTQIPKIVKTADADAAAKADDAAKIYQDATTKITDLLTDEQKTKLRQLQQAQQLQAQVDRMLANTTLTAEQKAKVQKLMEQAQKDLAAASDRQAQRDVRQKLIDGIRNDVLTEEQRAKLPPMGGGPGGGGR